MVKGHNNHVVGETKLVCHSRTIIQNQIHEPTNGFHNLSNHQIKPILPSRSNWRPFLNLNLNAQSSNIKLNTVLMGSLTLFLVLLEPKLKKEHKKLTQDI